MQVTVGGTLLWVGGWDIIVGGWVGGGEWGCMRHYFGWVVGGD